VQSLGACCRRAESAPRRDGVEGGTPRLEIEVEPDRAACHLRHDDGSPGAPRAELREQCGPRVLAVGKIEDGAEARGAAALARDAWQDRAVVGVERERLPGDLDDTAAARGHRPGERSDLVARGTSAWHRPSARSDMS